MTLELRTNPRVVRRHDRAYVLGVEQLRLRVNPAGSTKSTETILRSAPIASRRERTATGVAELRAGGISWSHGCTRHGETSRADDRFRGAALTRAAAAGGCGHRPPPRPASASSRATARASTRSAKNSHTARTAAIIGRATSTPGEPVHLRAREQPEDHEQRVQPQRVRHHVRDDDVTLDLVDEDEEARDPEERDRVDDERVERRGHGREPRPDVRDHLGNGDPGAEERARTRSAPGTRPSTPRTHMPSPALEPMIVESSSWPRDVAGERRLDPLRQRHAPVRAGSGGRSPARAAACRGACRSR